MKLFKPHLLLALILAAALSCENNQEQEVPDAKLAASLGSASVSAADNQIEGTVKGVSDWEVSLNNTSWAMVTKGAKQSGNFTVSFDPNNTDNDRKGTVVITSGKQKKTLEFTQKSRKAFFNPNPLALYGTDAGSVSFDAPASWTASVTSGEEWLSLATASGNKGACRLSCSAKSENESGAQRTGTIRLRINGGVLDLAVTQAVKGQNPDPQGSGPAPGIFGIQNSNFVLGEGGWNQSSRVVLSDGSLQYILMNRASVEIIAIIGYNPDAAVGSAQTVSVYRQSQSGVLLYQSYQVQVTESTDSYIKLANSSTTYFIIQK